MAFLTETFWTVPDRMDPCLMGPVDVCLKELHPEKKELSSVVGRKFLGQNIPPHHVRILPGLLNKLK